MRVSLIVTAAGASSRFKKSLPASSGLRKQSSKLFFDLGGISVLQRTLKAFSGISEIKEVFVTVQPKFEKQAKTWAKERGIQKVRWVAGGKTRGSSVLNALKKTSKQSDWVLVHDGARPFVSSKTIQSMFKQATKCDGVILAKQVVPTLKRVAIRSNQVLETVDRSSLVEAETPQMIRRQVLLEAYSSVAKSLQFTDESGLIEAWGGKINVCLHTGWNPKLTHFADYELAEAKMKSGEEIRIGNGYDIHRLVPGRKLWVGGVLVPFDKGSLAHSDGDALLHSVTDAILGSLGLGDIGDWFSDRNKKYKGIESSKLLKKVLEKTSKLGWEPYQLDANIILEKPKLAQHKVKIRKSLADLLKLPLDRVSIKARTFEKLPPIGTGDAWACQTIVLMKSL